MTRQGENIIKNLDTERGSIRCARCNTPMRVTQDRKIYCPNCESPDRLNLDCWPREKM